MIRGAGAVLATVAVLAGVPGTAAGASLPGIRAEVPRPFRAESLTWISPRRGWVLGVAQCGAYVTNRRGWAVYSPVGFFHGAG